MKKVAALLLTLAIALSFSFSVTEVEAAGPKIVKFANCKELNKVYPGGVAKSASVKNKGGKTKYKPFVSEALYNANAKSDRDKDFIACER
ncbi:excalibur calcium-binding domain-containing protein [Sporosarcina sp. FSL W7-1349]|uniref:excalibur calcium-binding domain-containing protein n=1 Tax=Sporosarcina sp. FSL W7-1349 TaxID=2921561 RepID=UPI0030F80E53